MKNDELIQYLTMIVDMEENCYLQDNLIKKLENVLKNDLKLSPVPSIPILDYKRQYYVFSDGVGCMLSIVALIFVFVLYVGLCYIVDLMGFDYTDIMGWLFLLSLIASPFICFSIPYLIALPKHRKKEQARFEEAKKKYADMQKEYDEAIKEMKDYDKKIIIQRKLIQENLENLRNKYNESSGFLMVAYAKNIIYPKYQNYVAVSTILDYLKSGRCSQLEGYEGAYNLYENESQMKLIVTKLDDVVNAVKQVSQGQFLLAKSIEDSNKRLNILYEKTIESTKNIAFSNMAGNLEQLNKTSAIAAYNAERIAQEVRYRNIKDGIYWNIFK